MNTLRVTTLMQAMVELLTEAYAGPPNPAGTWFIDNKPDCGILGQLGRLSAQQASTSVDGSGQAGTTLAANAEHLRWSLANANGALRGQPFQGNWKESWHMLGADEVGWQKLRHELRVEFEALCAGLTQQQELPENYLIGLLALIPHAAYHLGIIRQMIERLNAAEVGSARKRQSAPVAAGGLPGSDFPPGLGQPALRALAGAGLQRLEQVAARRESEILQLHGVGPRALALLRQALAAKGLAFAVEP